MAPPATLSCDPCGKFFSGFASYQQHIDSEKHKKKVQLEQKIINYRSSVADGSKLNFGKEIAENKSIKRSTDVIDSNVNMNSSNDAANDCLKLEKKDAESSNSVGPQADAAFEFYFSRCEVCNKMFSGPEPYEQHMVSIGHKKKMDQKGSVSSITNLNATLNGLFTCDTCKKRFSGPVPYDQHLKSDIHKKKVLNEQLMQNYMANGSLINSSINVVDSSGAARPKDESLLSRLNISMDSQSWYCDLCKLKIPATVSYNVHFANKDHQKNVEPDSSSDAVKQKNEFIHANHTPLQNGNLDQDEDLKRPKEREESFVKSTVSESSCAIQNYDSNSVLQDFKSLDAVTLENLQIICFMPDSELDFNKCGEHDSELKTPIQNEKAENEFYKLCTTCNVILKDIDEIASHYESRDHCMKKWSSKE